MHESHVKNTHIRIFSNSTEFVSCFQSLACMIYRRKLKCISVGIAHWAMKVSSYQQSKQKSGKKKKFAIWQLFFLANKASRLVTSVTVLFFARTVTARFKFGGTWHGLSGKDHISSGYL